MTTLNTTDDLLRAARANQEFREAFRREILTDDLVNLPQRMGEYMRENNAKIDSLTENVNTLTVNVDTLTKRVDALTVNVDSRMETLQQAIEANAKGISDLVSSITDMNRNLNERIDDTNVKIDDVNRNLNERIDDTNVKIDDVNRNFNERIDGMGEKIDGVNRNLNERIDGTNVKIDGMGEKIDGLDKNISEIRASHRSEHDALHRFRGNYAIETTRNNDGEIAEVFASARGINGFRLRTLTREERDDLYDDNLDSIELLDTEGNTSRSFPAGDIIAEASYRRSRDTVFYIAVEASYTLSADDVIRASDHAKILREVTGREAFAIVSGVEVNPEVGNAYRQRIVEDIAEYMESKREDLVFWFRLADRSLEPLLPC